MRPPQLGGLFHVRPDVAQWRITNMAGFSNPFAPEAASCEFGIGTA